MSDPNREYLLEQFRLVEEYLRRARGIAALSREEYLADPNMVDASVRQLTVLFETCHNIAKHLIARHGWRTPASKADTFEILSDEGVLPEGLSEAFRGAARFRNLVTYQTGRPSRRLPGERLGLQRQSPEPGAPRRQILSLDISFLMALALCMT